MPELPLEARSPSAPRGRTPGQRELALLARLVGLGLFSTILANIDQSNLPDYYSYFDIFNRTWDYGAYYYGLTAIMSAWKAAGLGYDGFRLMTLGLGVGLALWFLRTRGDIKSVAANASQKVASPNGVVFLALIFVFVLEFYLVRLRAGLSIFFFSSSLLLGNARSFYMRVLRRVAQFACLVFAAVIHVETFAALAMFVLVPLFWSRYLVKIVRPRFFLPFAALAWSLVFIFVAANAPEIRGAQLSSPLNLVRFLAISIVPVVLWAFVYQWYRRPRLVLVAAWKQWKHEYFPYMFSLNYLAAAVVLTLLFTAGQVSTSGEAVVRIITLSSAGAILSIALGGLTVRNGLAVYILVCNSLFFLNTVFL